MLDWKVGETDFGIFYGGDGRQLCVQLLGTLVIACWTCTINFLLFAYLNYRGKLRVAKQEELSGLNASIHGVPDKTRYIEFASCERATNAQPQIRDPDTLSVKSDL